MRFAPDDVMREMRNLAPGIGQDRGEQEFRNMVTNMGSIAQNILLESCPIFVKRLKASPRLAEQLKKIMQNWGGEEEEA